MKHSLKDTTNKNQKDRNWMVIYWAKYIREHSDKEWSEQQKEFINSLIE